MKTVLTRIVLCKTLRAAVLTLAMTALLAPAPAVQAAPAASAYPFGSVDLGKILTGYSKKAALDDQIKALNDQLDAQFKEQEGSDMLNKTQQQQLTALLAKSPRSAADTAQITLLEQQSAKDTQELIGLQQKSSPTAADSARLTALTQQHQAGQQALQDTADELKTKLQAEQDRLSTQLTDTIKAAVAAVAQQRGLTVVFNAQVAVYSANDITTEVLARLNK